MKKLDFITDSCGKRIYEGDCFLAVTLTYEDVPEIHPYRLQSPMRRNDGWIDFLAEPMDDYPSVPFGWSIHENPDGTPQDFAPGEFDRLSCKTCQNLLVCVTNGQVNYQA